MWKRGLPEAYSIDDLRSAARRRLPHGLFEFIDRGCEGELMQGATRAALDRIQLHPRVLVNVSESHARTTVFGREQSQPFAIAPTGAAGLLWHQGEMELARAAATAGVPFTMATGSLTPMELVAQEMPQGSLWFQMYIWPERRMSYQLMDRARAAGVEVLMITVDMPASPKRDYNKRNGFTLPMRANRRNALDGLMHPRWLAGVMLRYLLANGVPRHENYPEELRQSLAAQPNPKFPKNDTLSWDDLRELRKRWSGRLVVKGIVHPDDARQALACGADGVVVSNHGGRSFDSAPPAIEALPHVVDAVGSRMEVLVDSGFRRGSDVVKALSQGARCVLLGRAPL